ncbi:hypothetical protein Tco_0186832, partial [Tanacetum coccineum]
SPKFKFVDEDLVILRAPRKNDVYSLDLKIIIPSGGVTCLVAKATNDEVVLWHRRLGHTAFLVPYKLNLQQPTQGTDPKDKGKGILVKEPKKKKLTLQQIRALETTNDEEVARKMI